MPLQTARRFDIRQNGSEVLMDPIERLNSIVHVDFSKDVVKVRFDRVLADKEFVGNLLIRRACTE